MFSVPRLALRARHGAVMKTGKPLSIRNLILDWSGTVADDLAGVLRATNHVLVRYGAKPLTLDEFREHFSLPWIHFYRRRLPRVSEKDLDAAFWEIMRNEEDRVELLPHARAFLEFARARAMRVYICTSVAPRSFASQVRRMNLGALITRPYAGLVDKRDAIGRILQENSLRPEETLFVGDMVHDLETARHGGVRSCAVLTGYDRREKLARAKPDLLVNDLAELQARLEEEEGRRDAPPR